MLTIFEVKKYISDKGYILLDKEYTKAKNKLNLIDSEGYKYQITFDNFKQGKTPCRYSKSNEYSVYNIRLWLEENNNNIELLDEKFGGYSVKLKFKCKIDGKEWKASLNNILAGKGCPTCGIKKRSDSSRLSMDEIKRRLADINPDIEIIGGDYVNNQSLISFKCAKDDHIWQNCWANISQGQGCPKCANNIKLSINEVKERLKDINKNIEILSNDYYNNKEKLHCRCSICNNEWDSRWDNLYTGYGCPKCGIESISGENSYLWNNGSSEIHKHLRGKLLSWKRDTMNKCNYKCDITGLRFDEIHHLYGFDSIISEVFKNLNLTIYEKVADYSTNDIKILEEECIRLHNKYGVGVCLCENEHKLFHKIYGYGMNTPEQYHEFKKQRLLQLETA